MSDVDSPMPTSKTVKLLPELCFECTKEIDIEKENAQE